MKKGLLALLALACLLLTGCQYISLPVGEERAAPYLSVAKQVEEARQAATSRRLALALTKTCWTA